MKFDIWDVRGDIETYWDVWGQIEHVRGNIGYIYYEVQQVQRDKHQHNT